MTHRRGIVGLILAGVLLAAAGAVSLAQARPHCTMRGGSGDDVKAGSPARDVICTRGGDDIVSGLQGRDLIKGGRGADKAEGNLGNDVLKGGRGNDIVKGNLGKDVVKGGRGNDRVVTADGTKHNDVADGGKGKGDVCIVDKGDKTKSCETVKIG
jgi:Ca2+-binding RTX toxin-like protein